MKLLVSEIPGLADFLKSFCETLAKNVVTSPNYMCVSLAGQLMQNKHINKIKVIRGVIRVTFDMVQGTLLKTNTIAISIVIVIITTIITIITTIVINITKLDIIIVIIIINC